MYHAHLRGAGRGGGMNIIYDDKEICESLIEELENLSDEEWKLLEAEPD